MTTQDISLEHSIGDEVMVYSDDDRRRTGMESIGKIVDFTRVGSFNVFTVQFPDGSKIAAYADELYY